MKRFNIIIIEDDKAFIDAIKENLEDYKVDGYINASEGIEAIRTGSYDMLILDYLLGDINGTEVAKQVRAFNEDIIILLLTGYGDELNDINALKDMGINCFFEKSSNMERILLNIEFYIKLKLKSLRQRREFSEIIKGLREQRGLKQEELAAIFGLKRTTISSWEVGKSKPDADTLVKIAQYFNVSLDYLLSHEIDYSKETTI